MAALLPQVGDTVLIIDPESNDLGKNGTIKMRRYGDGTGQPTYGVTFGDNVLRYFKRDGFSVQTAAVDFTAPDPVPESPRPEFHITGYVQHGYTAGFGELTIRGNAADLFALAAELVKRG